MAIPLLGVLPKILQAAAKILGLDKVSDVVDALTKNSLTPEQQVALDAAAKEYSKDMRQLDIEEMKAVMSEAIAMIESPDKYVARARPTGLYVAYAATTALCIAAILNLPLDRTLILELILPLYGAQGYYMHLRTKEKMNGNGGD